MWTVLREGGPFHARYSSQDFSDYIQRLRDTEREQFARELAARKKLLKPAYPICVDYPTGTNCIIERHFFTSPMRNYSYGEKQKKVMH